MGETALRDSQPEHWSCLCWKTPKQRVLWPSSSPDLLDTYEELWRYHNIQSIHPKLWLVELGLGAYMQVEWLFSLHFVLKLRFDWYILGVHSDYIHHRGSGFWSPFTHLFSSSLSPFKRALLLCFPSFVLFFLEVFPFVLHSL